MRVKLRVIKSLLITMYAFTNHTDVISPTADVYLEVKLFYKQLTETAERSGKVLAQK